MEDALGPDHAYVAYQLSDLASVFVDQGRDADAIPLLERAAAILEKALPPDHPHHLEILKPLRDALRATGREEEAIEVGERIATIESAG